LKVKRVNRKIKIALAFALGLAIVQVGAAFAHPLGNFTVNRYAGIIVQPNAINIDYVVDMAEIPAYQEIQQQIGLASDGTPNQLTLEHYRDTKCAEFPSNFALR
jgi:nickel/cobalt transporter (NicO) family protein